MEGGSDEGIDLKPLFLDIFLTHDSHSVVLPCISANLFHHQRERERSLLARPHFFDSSFEKLHSDENLKQRRFIPMFKFIGLKVYSKPGFSFKRVKDNHIPFLQKKIYKYLNINNFEIYFRKRF